ncbi:kinase suppressor of Ras 1-like [Corticium candelabrum]|uniref:kinase suppressor of Ras 1-like n=1 Tax=Corticium candelabrum TaxID=121492 RepID=UPI002E277359|nr:kinase suppressor of Ras 1-like [Corticium candelabrum]
MAFLHCDHVFSDPKAIGVKRCSLCRKPMIRAIKCKRCKLRFHSKCIELLNGKSNRYSISSVEKGIMDVFPSVLHRVSGGAESRRSATCATSTPPVMEARMQVGHACAVSSSTTEVSSSVCQPARRARTARSCSVPTISFDRLSREGPKTLRSSPPRINAAVMERRASFDGTEEINSEAKAEEVEEFCIPFDGMTFGEKAGHSSKGNVYFGKWHGDVLIHTRPHQTIEDVQEFWKEVSVLSSIRHENIELFMGACMKPPHLAIVTCARRGDSLHTTLHSKRYKLPMIKKMKIVKEISQGMSYLHSRGIIHGSLTSHRVHLESRVLISMSSFTPTNYMEDTDSDRELLSYLSPEVLMALRLDSQDMLQADCLPTKQADRFAFGTILYEIFGGRYPYTDFSTECMIVQIVRGFRENLRGLFCSDEVKTIISLCWAQDPQYRPAFKAIHQALNLKVYTFNKKLHHSLSEPSQLDKLGTSERFNQRH